MRFLAAFVMRGRMQALMVASVLAVLALLITPLGIFSAAVVGLVTLRQGAREGLLVALPGLLVVALFGQLALQAPLLLASLAATLWLPLLGLGLVLRITRSLRLAVETAVLLGALLVALQYLWLPDPAAFWTQLLERFLAQMTDPAVVGEADRKNVAAAMAPWMAGALGTAWFLQLALSLLLARSWQAQLYNPGGFRPELHGLQLGRWLLILVPVLLVAGLLGGDRPNLAAQFSLIGMGAFFLQGVTLVHAIAGSLKSGTGWLVGFYVVLFVGMPPSFTAVSAAGYADGWLNFRARFLARPRNGG